ncbi:unnamed protein product [Heterobilharzia americana]|nr:unnamed protein product [Heterobilharzia americana]
MLSLSSGEMWLSISGLNYTLNEKLMLKIMDGICSTEIDFSRPNDKEKAAKKGIRNMIVSCKLMSEDEKPFKEERKSPKEKKN